MCEIGKGSLTVVDHLQYIGFYGSFTRVSIEIFAQIS
jgi:hypothetical protein